MLFKTEIHYFVVHSMLPSLSFSQRVKSLGNLHQISDEDFHRPPTGGGGGGGGGGSMGGGSAPPTQSGYSDSDSGHGGDVILRTRTPVLRRSADVIGHVQHTMVGAGALCLDTCPPHLIPALPCIDEHF